MTGGGLSTNNFSEYVGDTGAGSFTQSGGTNSIANGYTLCLGNANGSNGTYSLSGSSYLSSSNLLLGYFGLGNFWQTGGTNNAVLVYLGDQAGSSGTYNLGGGYFSNQGVNVRYSGTGSFTQSGGTHSVAGIFFLADGGGNGTYYLSGSALLSTSSEDLGDSGTGTFTQSGGTHNVANSLYLGGIPASSGAYNFGGGQLTAGSEYIGANIAPGVFQQTGGINTASLFTVLGRGRYSLGGGTLKVSGLSSHGIVTGGASPAVLRSTGIVDLSSGTWQNLDNVSLSMGTNSLLIVPAGSNASSFGFANFSVLGLTHTAGADPQLSCRPGVRRGRLSRRSRHLPRIDFGRHERRHQFDQHFCPLRFRTGELGLGNLGYQ